MSRFISIKPYFYQILWAVLIFFFSLVMFRVSLPYFTFETDVKFLTTKQHLLANDWWMGAFYIHVGVSVFILLSGAVQFSAYILTHYRRFHRIAGYVYVLGILFLSAPSGFIMALKANGGFAAKVSFVLTTVLWFAFTYIAWLKIRQRNIQEHKEFMIRSYALTLSAMMLRIYLFVLPFIVYLRPVEQYVTVAWLSWVPNLIVAEIIIYAKRKKGARL